MNEWSYTSSSPMFLHGVNMFLYYALQP